MSMGRERRHHLAVLVLIFLVGLPLVTTRVYAVDEVQYFAYARSMWMDGDFDFANDYRGLLEPDAPEWSGLRDARGELVNYVALGCGLLWAPFFLAGHLLAILVPAPADGFSWPYVAAVCYGSALYGFLGLLLLYDLAARTIGARPALIGTVAAWWTTALPFYMYATPPMSHATSLFAVSLLVWVWHRWREPDLPQAALLGALVGLATLVREQNLLFIALPLWSTARPLLRRHAGRGERRRALAASAAVIATVAATLIPQLFIWKEIFGTFGPPAERTGMLVPWPRYLLPLLLSANRGLISWHPAWLPAVAGLVILARRRAAFAAPLLGTFLLQVLFLASTPNWSGGMAFGQRRLVGSLFVVVLGLALLARRIGWRKSLVGLALLVWLNVSLLIQFGTGMIPRDGSFEWGAVIHNHLVRVPRVAVGVASRYLLHRESLFSSGGS